MATNEIQERALPSKSGEYAVQHFPAGFMFGAATSSHQVEGHCTNNDWWAWEEAGRVAERSGAACDHYRRFGEDFDLAQQLGHNAHRFSLEWSRIEPREGVFCDEAIEHYREVILALKSRGMEPVVTLHHFTLPLWLAEKGGWESPTIEAHFERYVVRVMNAFGDLARWWITINEPVAYIYKSYIAGEWPPGKKDDYGAGMRAFQSMLRAHVRAYRVIHDRRPDAQVGVAQHVLALEPDDPRSLRDQLSVRARGYMFNHLFVDALHRGMVRVPGLLWERLPAARTLDFLGLNYYTRDFVRNAGFDLQGLMGDLSRRDHTGAIGKRNCLGWEVYPEGMGDLLAEFERYRLPILISENGIATDRDADRWAFISMHLWQIARALGAGVPVVGYLYWSLLDNFEWAEGFRPRFGLIDVDFDTQERRVRQSALSLSDVIRRNRL